MTQDPVHPLGEDPGRETDPVPSTEPDENEEPIPDQPEQPRVFEHLEGDRDRKYNR